MHKVKSTIKQLGVLLSIPAIVYAVFTVLCPSVFFSLDTVYSILLQSCTVLLLAWSMTFTQTAGIMDLSIAAERVLGCIIGVLLCRTMGIIGLVTGSMATAIVVGALKSILNATLKISSMVISIAYIYIFGAIGGLIQNNKSMILTSELCLLGRAPAIWIIVLVSGCVIYFLNKYSVLGANCRALGSNGKLAMDAGINKAATEAKAIMISSFFVGISGIVATSYGAGTAAQTGLASMNIVFPAVIGFSIGRLLSKYVDVTLGCISGVVVMCILATGLTALGIPSQYKDTFTGSFLLILMLMMSMLEKKRAEAIRRNASQMEKEAT